MKFSLPTILIAGIVSLAIAAPTNKDKDTVTTRVIEGKLAIIGARNETSTKDSVAVRLRGEKVSDIEARSPAEDLFKIRLRDLGFANIGTRTSVKKDAVLVAPKPTKTPGQKDTVAVRLRGEKVEDIEG